MIGVGYMEYDIKEVIDELDFESGCFQYLENGISLTNHEINILEKYHIDYKKCCDLKSIIFLVESALNEIDYADDLEDVESAIAERDYYLNTNK